MIVGFTGTRNGMTHEQIVGVLRFLHELTLSPMVKDPIVALHGDCVGADADFDALCRGLGIKTTCRPCEFRSMRANTAAEQIAEPVAPMARNRAIVADADVMVACPPNKERIAKGSGTWATIGFSQKAKKPLLIVYPDGDTEQPWPQVEV